jgi:hypothetical protein
MTDLGVELGALGGGEDLSEDASRGGGGGGRGLHLGTQGGGATGAHGPTT